MPTLPALRSLRIRGTVITPPQLTHFRSSQPERPAVEFVAEMDGEVAARAYGPALYVGDVEIDHSERIGPATWRFLAVEPERLRDDAPIGVGWMKDPPASRRDTDYRYRTPEQ